MGVDCKIVAKKKDEEVYFYEDLDRLYVFNEIEDKDENIIHEELNQTCETFKCEDLDFIKKWLERRIKLLENKEGIKPFFDKDDTLDYYLSYTVEALNFLKKVMKFDIEYVTILPDGGGELLDKLFFSDKALKSIKI